MKLQTDRVRRCAASIPRSEENLQTKYAVWSLHCQIQRKKLLLLKEIVLNSIKIFQYRVTSTFHFCLSEKFYTSYWFWTPSSYLCVRYCEANCTINRSAYGWLATRAKTNPQNFKRSDESAKDASSQPGLVAFRKGCQAHAQPLLLSFTPLPPTGLHHQCKKIREASAASNIWTSKEAPSC